MHTAFGTLWAILFNIFNCSKSKVFVTKNYFLNKHIWQGKTTRMEQMHTNVTKTLYIPNFKIGSNTETAYNF